MRLVATALRCEQPCKAHRRAQFPRLRADLLCKRDRFAITGLPEFHRTLAQLQLTAYPKSLRPMRELVGKLSQRPFDRFKRLADATVKSLRFGQFRHPCGDAHACADFAQSGNTLLHQRYTLGGSV